MINTLMTQGAIMKLTELQNKLKVNKNNYNSFGKYSYRSAEDIIEAVKPLLLEMNASMQITDDVVHIGDRYYVKATVGLTFDDKEQHHATAFAREQADKKGMDAAQITGAASSYARKYALAALLLLDDGQDADSHGTGNDKVQQTIDKIDTAVGGVETVAGQADIDLFLQMVAEYDIAPEHQEKIDKLKAGEITRTQTELDEFYMWCKANCKKKGASK
jgi:hypothetical protein